MKKKFIAIALACVFALTLSSNVMAAPEVHDAMILYYLFDYYGYTEAKMWYPDVAGNKQGFEIHATYYANGSEYDSGEAAGPLYGWAYWESIGWDRHNSYVEIVSEYAEYNSSGQLLGYSSTAIDSALT